MRIVIVGAGFTGTMVAVHLAREARAPAEIVLVERAPRFGAGVAYSTTHTVHLLNVPACQMSAFPQDEGHFLAWAKARDASIRDGDFLPRQLFGQYVGEVLAEARGQLRPGVGIECVRDEATSIDVAPAGAAVRLASGRVLQADAVVLAIGNYPPADPPCRTPDFYASRHYRGDPWAGDALEIDPGSDVLLLGTGLTMVDVVVALAAAGHRGAITCVSRRGLVPQPHRDLNEAPPQLPAPASLDRWPRTALGILRGLRAEILQRNPDGTEWRDIVSSMRSVTPALWTSLSPDERRRFLGHLRPFWETHRHRAAPAIGRTIQRLRDAGQLRILAARALSYEVRGESVAATIRRRGAGAPEVLSVTRVINCTGPDTDLSRVQEPLVQQLRASGAIRPDELGLGLATDAAGRLLGRDGSAQARLFLAGPLLRGRLWENTAVPELRTDALRCARRVLESVAGAD